MDTKLNKVIVGAVTTVAAVTLGVGLIGNQVSNAGTMGKVSVIGERAIYTFEDSNGNKVKEFSTANDYNTRFIDGNAPPVKSGHKWVEAVRATHFDTADGFIHASEYSIVTEGTSTRVLFMLPDGRFYNWPVEYLLLIKTIPDEDLK